MKRKVRYAVFIPFYTLVLTGFLVFTQWGNRAVTVIAENAPLEDRHRVIIDAGHGGIDGGAVSCTGVLESQINLEIALRLDDLMHFLGYDTEMIRRSDISVYTEGSSIASKKVSDLKQRVKLVNETENGLLVSIHQNHFADSRYYGAQVFYTKDSEDLASRMQASFVQTLNPGSNRKSKKSEGVYLMEHIDCPGVLVECGFLSNPEEEAKLRDGDYQKKLCCVIAAAVSNYLSNT